MQQSCPAPSSSSSNRMSLHSVQREEGSHCRLHVPAAIIPSLQPSSCPNLDGAELLIVLRQRKEAGHIPRKTVAQSLHVPNKKHSPVYCVFQKDVLTPIGSSFGELISYKENSCKIHAYKDTLYEHFATN
jgi:hypothetical protein